MSATRAWNGTFEAHLTVETSSLAERARFEALCASLGVKCVLIELAAGMHRAQPMTSSHHRGSLADVTVEIEALQRALADAGFPVIRVKLEAILASDAGDAGPIADPAHDPHGYFEFHAKLRLDPTTDLAALEALCIANDAHLSRNDRKRDPRGLAERFVTLRVARVDRARAEATFEALLATLRAAGHPPIGTKREYTVYDGRPQLDAGWL